MNIEWVCNIQLTGFRRIITLKKKHLYKDVVRTLKTLFVLCYLSRGDSRHWWLKRKLFDQIRFQIFRVIQECHDKVITKQKAINQWHLNPQAMHGPAIWPRKLTQISSIMWSDCVMWLMEVIHIACIGRYVDLIVYIFFNSVTL